MKGGMGMKRPFLKNRGTGKEWGMKFFFNIYKRKRNEMNTPFEKSRGIPFEECKFAICYENA